MCSHPLSTINWSMTWRFILLKNRVKVIVNPWDKMISQNIDVIVKIHVLLHHNQRSNLMSTKTPSKHHWYFTKFNCRLNTISIVCFFRTSPYPYLTIWLKKCKSELIWSYHLFPFFCPIFFSLHHHFKQSVWCFLVNKAFFCSVASETFIIKVTSNCIIVQYCVKTRI